jgi:inositol transport system substrate-binding protein
VFQDAKGQGAGSVDTAVKMIKKQKVQDVSMIPYLLVTPENMSKFGSN